MTMVQACVETFSPSTCPLNLLYPSPVSQKGEGAGEEEDKEEAVAVAVVTPSVDLCEWIIMSLEEADPDSTSLLPHQIALIDLGDKLIVRIGREVDTQKYGTLSLPIFELSSPLSLCSLSLSL
jgi:hypothetical protein